MRTLRQTMESGVPDPFIAMYANSARDAARMVLGWKVAMTRVDLGLSRLVDVGTPGSVQFLCHRPCAPWAHFHAAVEVTFGATPIADAVREEVASDAAL